MAGAGGRTWQLLAALLAFGGFQAACLAWPGAIMTARLEGDVLHLLDALFRIELGQRPHLDFHTPLGALALHAVAAPMALGAGPGMAMIWGNVAATAAILPFALWLRRSRLGFGAAFGLGAAAMLVACSLAYDAAANGASYGMYYNRWCWALFLVAAPILVLPPRRGTAGADLGDGLALGVAGALLFWLKITYFAAFAAAGFVWLLAARRWRAAGVAAAAGLAGLVGLMFGLGGPEVLAGYIADLRGVLGSDIRPRPGGTLAQVVARPEHAPISALMLISAALLARAGWGAAAAVWGVLAVGIFYIAYQNFGNALLGALAVAFIVLDRARSAPSGALAFGAPAGTAMRYCGFGLLLLFTPYLLKAQASVFSAWARPQGVAPILALHGAPDILWRADEGRVFARVLRDPGAAEEPDRHATSFAGADLTGCILAGGAENAILRGAAELREIGVGDRTILTADAINPLWFLSGAPPQRGVHIWYYAPLDPAAVEEVDVVAAPLCAAGAPMRNGVLRDLEATGAEFEVLRETRHWIFFERIR